MQGLEAQLLGIVVREERPELEEQKDSLVISIASGKKRLQELEDEILRLLSHSLYFTVVFEILHVYMQYLELNRIVFNSLIIICDVTLPSLRQTLTIQ